MIRVAIVLLLLASPVAAEPTDAETKASSRQVLIALRILSYDKALADRTDGPVTIAVVSGLAGRSERERWQAGFTRVPKVKVGGRSVRFVAFDYTTRKAFGEALQKHDTYAVIVTGDLDVRVAEIRAETRARHVVSFGSERALRDGLSVALVPRQQRDEIVINLEASRAEGARFAAGLLQLAKIVEGAP